MKTRVTRPDEQTLRKLYLEDKLSLTDIASHYGVWFSTVANWMQGYGIRRRTPTKAARIANTKQEFSVSRNELAQLYYGEHMTLEQLSCKFDKSISTINFWMKRYGIRKSQVKTKT